MGREFGGRGNNFSGFSVGFPQFPELGFLKEQGSLRFSPRCLAALAPQPSPPLPSASQLQSACPLVPCHDSCWSKMNPGLLYCGQILYHLRHQRSAVSLGDGNYVCTSWSGHRGVCIRPRFFSTPMSEAALFDDWSFREPSNQGLMSRMSVSRSREDFQLIDYRDGHFFWGCCAGPSLLRGLFLVVWSRGLLHSCGVWGVGCSLQGLLLSALGCVSFSGFGSRALEHRLSGWGAWA